MQRIGGILIFLLIASIAVAQTAEEVFGSFEKAYTQNDNFSAEFEQTTFQQDHKSIAYGRLFYAKPNLLRMEYFEKENPKLLNQVIVLDGKHAWSYTPVLNQVNKSVQTQQGNSGNLLPGLGASFDYVRQHYAIELVPDEAAERKGVYHLALSPKDALEFRERVEVWIRKKDWLPVQFSYQTEGQPGGDFTVITSLTKIQINRSLPAETFRFVIPEGAEVVTIAPQ